MALSISMGLKRLITVMIMMLGIFLIVVDAAPVQAAGTRDVKVLVYVIPNTSYKTGTYHIDLVRRDGSTVGWGFDVSINNKHTDWRIIEVRFVAVPTNQNYRIRVRKSGQLWQGDEFWLSSTWWWVDEKSYWITSW